MSRMIMSENSLYSLQMKCFYISSEYKRPNGPPGTNYIKDIFEE
jgi:hypothetical protein